MSRHWPVRAAAPLVLVLLLVSGLAGCRDEPAEPTRIRIATGSPTAVYHAFGQSLAAVLNRELPGVRAEVVVTAASAQNVRLVGSGAAELGFTQADVLPAREPEHPSVLAVARVYDDLLHLVTRAGGPIRTLADLRGRRVSVGADGSGTEITATRLLEVAQLDGDRIRQEHLGLDDSMTALREDRIDAFFFSGGLPVRGVADLAERTSLRIVDLGEWTEALRRGYGQVYVTRDIPRSMYQAEPVSTVANPNYLIVRADLPAALVRDVTRLLMERRAELAAAHPAAGRMSQRSAIVTTPLPLHPGAAQWYRAAKP
ncbi:MULTISPECIES: TAXI family TRAP transporter solute-binding subunit [Micromonospora]|uniref:C4-dicarboxylate ABC transporter substrate-binding protein n=1 Tax=Micromonospora chalcea TaxID=1874 RepID=A0ABX9Y6R3_MICCH|nr:MULTISPECIES: TAXI family TRAP transporter solute-binding subunit [Micromonospora]MBC8989315.1 TAXI family TRAP transporter solute-binding subunit [Micromonospora chalcea]MBQ1063029.1 TAXI family TRAP transporter solute-binding subunit [Micromonospora sp. C41]MBQ1067928.1 TAXI family TRAP transporter solute-binding subunit [Micromonospora sp. D75]MCK1806135.1 TAXI family TRAP transporter solute-binding subunit [Micromonospora sp. R42106]MCK1830669.1 TAXI family TRAP transporter solute-bindi